MRKREVADIVNLVEDLLREDKVVEEEKKKRKKEEEEEAIEEGKNLRDELWHPVIFSVGCGLVSIIVIIEMQPKI